MAIDKCPQCGMSPCSRKPWNGCVDENGRLLIGRPEPVDIAGINAWYDTHRFDRDNQAAIRVGALLAEVERLTLEGKRDYDGMREFQWKYIAADQELRTYRDHRCKPTLGNPTREEAMDALDNIRKLSSDVLEHWGESGRPIVETLAMILTEASRWPR